MHVLEDSEIVIMFILKKYNSSILSWNGQEFYIFILECFQPWRVHIALTESANLASGLERLP